MAFGGFNQDGRQMPMSEINMVPLIDVMLVLLIVFMITAPLLTHAVKIELPTASAAPAAEQAETVTLAMDGEGGLFWNDAPLLRDALAARLAATAALEPQPELHLRADRDTRYQALAEVMAEARAAGIRKMGFVAVPVP